jgi:ATP-dependent DNA helicase RecQ
VAYDILKALSLRHLISFIPRKQVPYIRYLQRREDKEHIQLPRTIYEDRQEQYRKRIEAMTNYAQTTNRCRSRMLLEYFGEETTKDCGQCDVCLHEQGQPMTPAEQHDACQQILALLPDRQRHHITELYRLQLPVEKLNAALKTLIENEKIRQDDGFITIV